MTHEDWRKWNEFAAALQVPPGVDKEELLSNSLNNAGEMEPGEQLAAAMATARDYVDAGVSSY